MANAIWQYCQERDIPMWSAEKLLDFNLARNESQFANAVHAPGSLEFDYIAGAAGLDLTLMLPLDWSGDRLTSILMDGSPIEWFVEEIKGIEYAMFTTPVAEAHIAASYIALQSADFNADGRVDELDLARWEESFSVDTLADANGDEVTDGADFLVWQRQFNAQPLRPTTSVPEPASLLLLTAAAACALPLRRSRRDR